MSDCVFCDRTKVGERLIAEDKNSYVVATLGQIIGGYTLVIPKAHIPCLGALAPHCRGNQTKEMLRIVFAVCRALALEYQSSTRLVPRTITAFEHGIVGQSIKHAHLHLLPAEIDLTPRIRADFPNSEFEELQDAVHLPALYHQRPEPYLFWTVPSGKSMVCWNPPAPPQYLRIVAAELLGWPERADWRAMDPELDRRLWQETVRRLKPYFL